MKWALALSAIIAGAILLLLKMEWRYWGSLLALRITRLASLLQGDQRERWRYRKELYGELYAVRHEYDVPGFTWACLTLLGAGRAGVRRGMRKLLRPFRRKFAQIPWPQHKPIRRVRVRIGPPKAAYFEYVVYGRGDSAQEVLTLLGMEETQGVAEDLQSAADDDEVASGFLDFLRIRGKIDAVGSNHPDWDPGERADRGPLQRYRQIFFWTCALLAFLLVSPLIGLGYGLVHGARAFAFTRWWLTDKPDKQADSSFLGPDFEPPYCRG